MCQHTTFITIELNGGKIFDTSATLSNGGRFQGGQTYFGHWQAQSDSDQWIHVCEKTSLFAGTHFQQLFLENKATTFTCSPENFLEQIDKEIKSALGVGFSIDIQIMQLHP